MSTRQEAQEKLILKSMKDPSFRDQLKANPKAAISQELGVNIPDDVTVEVVEESADKLYLVLPPVPSVEEELSEEQLEAVAGGRGSVSFITSIRW